MLKMSRIIYLLAILALAGCGASKQLPIESAKDSVSVIIKESIIYRDSVVYVEVPAEADKAILPADDTSHLETSLAVSEAWVKDGQLNHILSHKPNIQLPKVVTIPIYLKSEETEHLSHQVVVKEVEKNLTSWQSFRMTLGTISIIVLLLWLIFKVIRRFVLV